MLVYVYSPVNTAVPTRMINSILVRQSCVIFDVSMPICMYSLPTSLTKSAAQFKVSIRFYLALLYFKNSCDGSPHMPENSDRYIQTAIMCIYLQCSLYSLELSYYIYMTHFKRIPQIQTWQHLHNSLRTNYCVLPSFFDFSVFDR